MNMNHRFAFFIIIFCFRVIESLYLQKSFLIEFSRPDVLSGTNLCLTLCDPMDYRTSGFPVLHHLLSLLKPMSIESMMPSNHLILCCPLLLPSIFPASESFPVNQLFALGDQSMELQLQHQSFQ